VDTRLCLELRVIPNSASCWFDSRHWFPGLANCCPYVARNDSQRPQFES